MSFLTTKIICIECGKEVSNKYVLRNHVNNVHTKYGSNVECEYCHKTFKFKENVKYRFRAIKSLLRNKHHLKISNTQVVFWPKKN